MRLVAVLAFDAGNTLAVGRSQPFSGSFPALTATHPQAHLFEREIWEQHGVVPEGHPWLKPVRQDHGAGPAVGDFFRVDGREIHEVAVGPVHAGIIEPGHFRFQCAGEEVLHLEIALGYQHRGVEEALAGGPHRATVYQMETVAGDTTIAHATAYATAARSAGAEPKRRCAPSGCGPSRSNWNGWPTTPATSARWPATSRFCPPPRPAARFAATSSTSPRCSAATGSGAAWSGPAVAALDCEIGAYGAHCANGSRPRWPRSSRRRSGCGMRRRCGRGSNTPATCMRTRRPRLGLVGPAARACGLVRDVRFDHPAGWHRFAQVPVSVWPDGDVFARARVRWLEIQRSGEFLREQFDAAPEGETMRTAPGLRPRTRWRWRWSKAGAARSATWR